MTYAAFITFLRNQVGDRRRRVHVDWTGDGSTQVFQFPEDTFPILDQSGTHLIKVNSVNKTEGIDYTLDKNTGTLVFTVAPTNGHSVTADCSAVYLTDANWIEVINMTIYSLGNDFWKEFVDETFVTTANMLSFSLTSKRPSCIAVYDFAYRKNTAENWRVVDAFVNWRYDMDNNTIYIGTREAFPVSNELLRIRGLNTYSIGTATTDTIDVQDRFLTILEYGSIARYWRNRYKNVVELVSKMTQESTRTPLQELIMLSDRFDRLYESEKAKLKPQKPSRIIPKSVPNGGRP